MSLARASVDTPWRSRITGHAEVPPPSTHTDPGTGWDWNKYIGYVNSYR